jgi:hypothetical protein
MTMAAGMVHFTGMRYIMAADMTTPPNSEGVTHSMVRYLAQQADFLAFAPTSCHAMPRVGISSFV